MYQEKTDFIQFATKLYEAQDVEQAFDALQKTVWNIGFDGVLYTYIPRVLLDTHFHVNPVFLLSEQYNPGYISHYTEARFEKSDPLVRAVQDGVDKPIDWWGHINQQYMDNCKASNQVIETARCYGINNGITIPLLSGEAGIAGASFITSESQRFDTLRSERLTTLNTCVRMFHSRVQDKAPFKQEFIKPILETLNRTEIKLLIGMAQGKGQSQIATELGRSEGYLEQVILKLRRKFSGVSGDEAPTINRNQLLYYAGLLEIIQFDD